MGNKITNEVSLTIKGYHISLKVNSNMKIGALRSKISSKVKIPIEDLVIEIAG
jgi:Na+-translocating ferredoxin:NAD+ oxidoreductase RnfE subunit